MSYKHLNTFERGKIEAFNKLGYSARKIAKILNRNNSTISRELIRLNSSYDAEQAQNNYHIKRLKSSPKGKFNKKVCVEINQALNDTWSPEQIANTITKERISF